MAKKWNSAPSRYMRHDALILALILGALLIGWGLFYNPPVYVLMLLTIPIGVIVGLFAHQQNMSELKK